MPDSLSWGVNSTIRDFGNIQTRYAVSSGERFRCQDDRGRRYGHRQKNTN